jgi:hypothetical protein
MIKFSTLIHKETGTVIKYEDWKKLSPYDDKTYIDKNHSYSDIEMLFSDDFEIIYDSDFTLEELRILFRGNQKYNEELMKKICKKISDKEYYKQYGIEV